MASATNQWDGSSLHTTSGEIPYTLLEQTPQLWDTLVTQFWLSHPSTNTSTVTGEKAGVAWVWVELAKTERAVWALGEGARRVLIE